MAAGFSSARASILRSALLFSPFFALSALLLVVIAEDVASDGFDLGYAVGLGLAGFVTLLLGYQVVQSIRDLFSPTVETVGVVGRQWSRSEFMLFRHVYIFVEDNVFRLRLEEHDEVKLGDTVRVVHYPHTSTVESVEVVERASAR